VSRAHDCLRIVGLAVNYQPVRASRAEPVLFEKPVLAEPVILRHGLANLVAGQLPQCHAAIVDTCVWQSCQTQPVANIGEPPTPGSPAEATSAWSGSSKSTAARSLEPYPEYKRSTKMLIPSASRASAAIMRLGTIALLPRHTTVTEQTIAGLRADVVSSQATGSGLTVIHYHGGGYCLGSAVTARSWART
jgi:hypothetical protein